MTTLILDFETSDKNLNTLGPGWVFGTCDVLGMGYKVLGPDGHPFATGYTNIPAIMNDLLTQHNTWVAHNISYELGIAKYVLGVEFKDKIIYCTKVGAYLEDSNKMTYSLESLASEVGLEKDQQRMGRYAIEAGLHKVRNLKTDPGGIKAATNWAMANLDVIEVEAPELIEEYCKSDVDITHKLHQKYLKEVGSDLYRKFSSVNKVLVEMRAQGVRVDLDRVKELKLVLDEMIVDEDKKIKEFGYDFNYASSRQCAEVFNALGIEYPYTEKCTKDGFPNPNIDGKFYESCNHPIAKHIVNIKKYIKAKEDFLESIEKFAHDGRIHGSMQLFGAMGTGRFSHRLPNLSQIPRRDEVIGPMMRSVFLPEEGEEWVELDYKAAEPRLMIHFSLLCHKQKVHYKARTFKDGKLYERIKQFNCPELIELQRKYQETPDLDNHTYNQKIMESVTGMKIDRSLVKTIALGKAYGMGIDRLSASLGLSKEKAQEVIKAFYKAAPYIMQIDDYCKYVFRTCGGIKTLSGRVLKYDKFDHKALNKKNQGSNADLMCECLLQCYDMGLIPKLCVHDSLSFSGSKDIGKQLKLLMENAVKLEIPMYVDMKIGPSWAEAV